MKKSQTISHGKDGPNLSDHVNLINYLRHSFLLLLFLLYIQTSFAFRRGKANETIEDPFEASSQEGQPL